MKYALYINLIVVLLAVVYILYTLRGWRYFYSTKLSLPQVLAGRVGYQCSFTFCFELFVDI